MGEGMRHIDLDGLGVFVLTDCAPAQAACAYSFPDADLSAHPQAAGRWLAGAEFRTRFGAYLLRSEAGDVLVDCGVGPGPNPYFPGLRGELEAALAVAGSSLERVGTVVFTHLHLDHVGWAPFLSAATFLVAESEWTHWSRREPPPGLPHHVAAVERCVAPLAEAGRLRVLASGAEFAPGMVLHAAGGHTPGHHVVLVRDRLLIAGDAWHNPAQVEVPAWCHRADSDKPAAVATRTRLATDARDRGWLVAAGHFTEENAFGRITGEDGALSFQPRPG